MQWYPAVLFYLISSKEEPWILGDHIYRKKFFNICPYQPFSNVFLNKNQPILDWFYLLLLSWRNKFCKTKNIIGESCCTCTIQVSLKKICHMWDDEKNWKQEWKACRGSGANRVNVKEDIITRLALKEWPFQKYAKMIF